MTLSAAFIADLVNGPLAPDLAQVEATGVAFHSARLKAGDIFFAFSGESFHGLDFAEEALAKGAAFIVSDRPYKKTLQVANPAQTLLDLGAWARSQLSCPVIGITGSAGKTSTRAFVATALNAEATLGNFNTPLALAQTLITHALSKSEAPLVLEMGIDHVGEMAQLVALVKPSHGILTSVSAAHLAGLGSLTQVAKEKAQLFSGDVQTKGARALVSLQAAAKVKPYIETFETYGLGSNATGSDGTDSSLTYRAMLNNGVLRYKEVNVKLPIASQAMATNALAALALAEILGFDLHQAAKRLEQTVLESARLELKQLGNLSILDDTYNSNPLSATEALQVLKTLPQPHTVILGDMLELGADSHFYHAELGKQTLGLSVYAIGREAINILEGNPKARHFLTVEAFLAQLAQLNFQGSVLIKGSRGMRLERIVEALQEGRV